EFDQLSYGRVLWPDQLRHADPCPATQIVGQAPQHNDRYREGHPGRSGQHDTVGDSVPALYGSTPEVADEIGDRLGQLAPAPQHATRETLSGARHQIQVMAVDDGAQIEPNQG